MERRLEMAHEGIRFFDLVRWGIADEVLNVYLRKKNIPFPLAECSLCKRKA